METRANTLKELVIISVTIKWIPHDDTATDAGDAGTLAELAFGTIQINVAEETGGSAKRSFKIGNTGTSKAEDCELSFTGANSEAVGWKTLCATEGGSYTTTLEIADIDEDAISPVLWAQSTVPYTATTGNHETNLTIEYTYV